MGDSPAQKNLKNVGLKYLSVYNTIKLIGFTNLNKEYDDLVLKAMNLKKTLRVLASN